MERCRAGLRSPTGSWGRVTQGWEPSFLAPVLSSDGAELCDVRAKLSVVTPATPRVASEDEADIRSSAFLL